MRFLFLKPHEIPLESLHIGHGGHSTASQGTCVMEAAAYVAGEIHSDHPACVNYELSEAMIQLNDRAIHHTQDKNTATMRPRAAKALREKWLRPLIPEILNTHPVVIEEGLVKRADWDPSNQTLDKVYRLKTEALHSGWSDPEKTTKLIREMAALLKRELKVKFPDAPVESCRRNKIA